MSSAARWVYRRVVKVKDPDLHPREERARRNGSKRRGARGLKDPARATTRGTGRKTEVVVDPDTGVEHEITVTHAGRRVDKNRSSHYGYKSHLTKEQKRVIRWALRQRDRGISRGRIYDHIVENDLFPLSSMQYPLRPGSIGGWEFVRMMERRKDREWPQ